MNRTNKNQKTYWAQFNLLPDGKIKITRASKLIGLNQHKNTWRITDTRNLARKINRSELIIK